MANIQELDNQISIIEADKELLYDILTNKNIAGLSVLDSLETYVKSVSKLSNYAMYDFNTEADMNKSKSYPIGTYGLVIKEVAEESKYNDSTEDTLYTSFDVPSRVQDINYKKIADNQEIVININTDLGNTVGQLKITSIDARLNIKINTYTVKVQWNRIPSEAGEYILSLYEINGVDDYKGGTNYILPEAVDLVLMTEIEDVDLKKSLLKFMPLKNAIYDSLNVYAQTEKWELLFKQLEYEVDTQIKVYNTLEEMNADTVDNYAIGIVLNTEEALRLTTDVVQENRIYKQIILGPEVIINVPKVATRFTYAYSDANDEVTVTLVKEATDEDTRLVLLSSKDYKDAISEVTYSTDITYTYKVKNKVENTDYDVYTFEISSKSTYDSKLGITERVNIDSSEFDRVEIDTPKTNTSSVTITSNNCEIIDGLYGKILYINNNQNNEDNHWEFSGIYMYNGNTWQALALGLNASASTIFTGYKAYTDSGAVTGTGTSDANAVATDIMSGKSAYVNGVKLIGTFSLDTELAEQDRLLTEQTQDISDVITALENRIALGLQEATSDANAVAGDITKDKTAYVNGVKLVGTLEQLDTSDATATASDMASGKTAYVNGEKVTGIVPEVHGIGVDAKNGGTTHTAGYLFVEGKAPQKMILNYNDYIKVSALDYDVRQAIGLTADKLKKDETILGVTGTYEGTSVPDWSQIGYSGVPQEITNGFNIARIIMQDWTVKSDYSYELSGYGGCIFMPLVDTSNAIIMGGMLYACYSLITVPLLNTSNVTNMESMFGECSALLTIPQFDTSNVINMSEMFVGCRSLITVPLLNTSNVTNMESMFGGCDVLSDESLNNVLAMCIGATSYTGTKTLVELGLSPTQAETCQTLSNWDAFVAAGWSSGY